MISKSCSKVIRRTFRSGYIVWDIYYSVRFHGWTGNVTTLSGSSIGFGPYWKNRTKCQKIIETSCSEKKILQDTPFKSIPMTCVEIFDFVCWTFKQNFNLPVKRGWKQTRIVQLFDSKNFCWGAKWPNVQSNCTKIQIVGLFCNSRLFVRGINFIKKMPHIKRLLSSLIRVGTDNGEIGPRSRPYHGGPIAVPNTRRGGGCWPRRYARNITGSDHTPLLPPPPTRHLRSTDSCKLDVFWSHCFLLLLLRLIFNKDYQIKKIKPITKNQRPKFCLPSSACMRSWCNWSASCVAA